MIPEKSIASLGRIEASQKKERRKYFTKLRTYPQFLFQIKISQKLELNI